MKKILLLAACLLLPGCAILQDKIPIFGKRDIRVNGVYKDNLDPDRLVDLVIVKKLTGEKRFWIFSKYTPFLEGYIRGVVVDYDDTPIEGVVVRVSENGKDIAGFDPGVSDPNGIYKVRFSLPFNNKKNKKIIDISGAISYNPPWQQQIEMLGASLEPQTKESKFRLYYNRSSGMLGIGEDTPKTIVRKSTPDMVNRKKDDKKGKSSAYSPQTPAPNYPPAPNQGQLQSPGSVSPPAKTTKKNEDFFGGFGDFGN